jgi:hypothetical protein
MSDRHAIHVEQRIAALRQEAEARRLGQVARSMTDVPVASAAVVVRRTPSVRGWPWIRAVIADRRVG